MINYVHGESPEGSVALPFLQSLHRWAQPDHQRAVFWGCPDLTWHRILLTALPLGVHYAVCFSGGTVLSEGYIEGTFGMGWGISSIGLLIVSYP